MKIQIGAVIILLLASTTLFSGCGVLKTIRENSAGSTRACAVLLSKKEELADFQPTGAITDEATPKIKGKIVIVKKEAGGQVQLDRFNWEGKFSDEPAGGESSRFYPPEVYAKLPKKSTL